MNMGEAVPTRWWLVKVGQFRTRDSPASDATPCSSAARAVIGAGAGEICRSRGMCRWGGARVSDRGH
ncbi:hypothetical protein FTUN_2599 [Frigoriglobus tundricola]|uniref:Uncharacterized protein n=1 Tax=Frigoriglobus tundricola TaxID=2774151 RepID=A0A6M5YP73_9BACT|nr:hypothetical protein FTUN_2599 [Frigoriglobus tundricola]